jgi:hypothetical protein
MGERKNPAKIMPVWVLSILSVGFSVFTLISDLTRHAALADMGPNFAGLAFGIRMLVIANNIKKEAGR